MSKPVHAVAVIFEDPDGSILVLKRNKNRPEGETWGLVGGKLDVGENMLEAAIRETQEEINHTVASDQLNFIKTYHWDREDIDATLDVFKYNADRKKLEVTLDTDENTEHMWVMPAELHSRTDLMVGLYPILEDEYGI